MHKAYIKEQYISVYNERLQEIQPTIELAKNIIRSKGIELKNIYITGDCAAWLTGRIHTFDEVIILLLGQVHDVFVDFYFEYCINNCPARYDHSNTLNSKMLLMEFKHEGPQTICFLLTEHKILDGVKSWLSFAATSVFVNLFDTNEICTTECLCNYEMNCIVTQNGCMNHGRIVYPLLIDSTDFATMHLYDKLSNEEKQLMRIVNTKKKSSPSVLYRYTKTRELYNKATSQMLISRFIKYSRRLNMAPDLFKDNIMSFCNYSCIKCKSRYEMTKKYADIWWSNTYAPGGNVYKVAEKRFKGINIDSFKQYCTCPPIN